MRRTRLLPLLVLCVGVWAGACSDTTAPEPLGNTPSDTTSKTPTDTSNQNASDTTGQGQVNQADSINLLVAGIPQFQPAPEWAERLDSASAPDTVDSTSVDGNVITDTKWIEQTVHYSASENPDDYMMFNPLASVLWPGNLVQGKSIAGGVPDAIPVTDRAAGNITLAIVSGDSSGTANEFSRTIEHFRYSDVNQAMNEILAGYQGGTPAKYSYSFEQVYSASQLNFDLGLGYSGPAVSVNSTFGFKRADAKSRIAVRLTQQFFTMVFDDPQGPAGVFGPSVTAETLRPYTGDGNPICYISSVTYGRIYILLYESTASMQDLQAALQFAYAGASGSTAAQFQDVMTKTTVSIMQIGGDPEAGLATGAGQNALNLTSIRDFLVKGANFSASNPGEPISYTIKYLNDASLVRMNNVMDYTVTQRTPVSSSTSYTKSRFELLFLDVLNVSSEESDGAEAGVQVHIYSVDGTTAKTTKIWDSQTPNDGVVWQVGWGWDPGQVTALPPTEWTVPEFELPDDPNVSLYVEFDAAEFDGPDTGWEFGSNRQRFVYDATQRRWVFADGASPSNPAELYCGAPGTVLKIRYNISRNNSPIT